LCHLRRVACAIKASCLITREGFHHPTIGHQVGHKAWQRLRRQLGFICVRINPIQDHLHIPQLGIKHMHGAVHISPEGATWILVVCLLHPTIGYQRGGTRPSLRVVASQRFLPEGNTWNGDGRLQRSHLGEMWYYQHLCPGTPGLQHCCCPPRRGLEWEGPGGLVTPVWVDDCVASSTTSVSYSSKTSGTAQHLAGALTAASTLIHTSREALSGLSAAARCEGAAVCQTLRTNCSSWQLQSARPLRRL